MTNLAVAQGLADGSIPFTLKRKRGGGSCVAGPDGEEQYLSLNAGEFTFQDRDTGETLVQEGPDYSGPVTCAASDEEITAVAAWTTLPEVDMPELVYHAIPDPPKPGDTYVGASKPLITRTILSSETQRITGAGGSSDQPIGEEDPAKGLPAGTVITQHTDATLHVAPPPAANADTPHPGWLQRADEHVHDFFARVWAELRDLGHHL